MLARLKFETAIMLAFLLALVGCASLPTREDVLAHPSTRERFEQYQTSKFPDFKAFAVLPGTGRYGIAWGYRDPSRAVARALKECEKTGEKCRLFAVGNRVVFGLEQEQITHEIDSYQRTMWSERERLTSDAQRLNAEALRRLFTQGFTANVINFDGREFIADFSADGSMSVRKISQATAGRESDTGKWWLKGDMFCSRFDHWLDNRVECEWIVEGDGIYKVFNAEGKHVASFTR